MQIEQTYILEAITCRSLHPFQTIYLFLFVDMNTFR